MLAIFTPVLARFRFYADGTESGSTALAAENTNATLAVASDYNLGIRIGIDETGGSGGASTDDWQLQYSKNGGAYTDVNGSSSNVRSFNSSNLTDGNATTRRLSGDSPSFIAGEIDEANGAVEDHLLGSVQNTEHLYSVTLRSADLASGNTLDFRITKNGTAITSNITPRITIQNLTHYTLTAAQGSYSLSGQAATLRAARLLTAAQGSYSLSGQAATLRATRILAAGLGLYDLSGDNVPFRIPRHIEATFGLYSLNGQDANLLHHSVIAAAVGLYSLNGQDALFHYPKRLAVDTGFYVLSGQETTRHYTLGASTGFYVVNGRSANLLYSGAVVGGLPASTRRTTNHGR